MSQSREIVRGNKKEEALISEWGKWKVTVTSQRRSSRANTAPNQFKHKTKKRRISFKVEPCFCLRQPTMADLRQVISETLSPYADIRRNGELYIILPYQYHLFCLTNPFLHPFRSDKNAMLTERLVALFTVVEYSWKSTRGSPKDSWSSSRGSSVGC